LLLGAYRGRFEVPNLGMLNKESYLMCLLFKKITTNYKRQDVQHNGPPKLLANGSRLTASCSYLSGSVKKNNVCTIYTRGVEKTLA